MKTHEEIKKKLSDYANYYKDGRNWGREVLGTGEIMADALVYIQQLEAQVPKWISAKNPPQVEGEYIVIVQLPDGKKERMWDIYHPYDGWCEDAENKVVCWMSFDSLPEPPKEG